MFDKLLIALSVAVVLYSIWLFIGASMKKHEEMFEAPARAPLIQQAQPLPPRVVVSSGPNPPSAESDSPPELSPEVKPKDPYDDPNSSESIEDNLRSPERMFSPGVKNTDTRMGVHSGVASHVTAGTAQALQTFTPEMAMNGGEFMQGISANDSGSNSEYATF
jgi:hypothetical protein